MFRLAQNRLEKKIRKPFVKETEFGFEVESLESRKMLAGNVDVIVSGDNSLVITGDSADNDIVVTVLAGDIRVLDRGGETVTNGGLTGLAATDLNKLTITMKGGNDRVVVTSDVSAQGRVRMTGGSGTDRLVFTGDAGDKLQIIGGTGDDLVAVDGGATVAGTFTLIGGGGDDDLRILRATANGKVIVKAGGGDDNARVDDATFTSDVKVNMGHGADTMNVGSAGAPTASTFGPKTTLAFGGGDDVLVIIAAPMIPAGGTFLINGGAGTDLSNPAPAVLDAITGVTVKSFEGLLV